MKKLALALVAATAITTAADANCSFSGFYIGAHTGYDNANAKFEGHYLTGGQHPAGTQTGSTEAGKGHANFGAYVGYNFMSGCALFGAEMAYTFTKLDMDVKNGDSVYEGRFHAELKRKGYFTFAARMGYLLSPSTVAYVRLGANYGKWDAKVSNHSPSNGGAVVTSHHAKGHKHRLTFAPGVGLETALNRNVLLRAEWTYEFGSKSKCMEPVTAAGGRFGSRYNFKSVHANSFKVGVAYKF